MIRRALRFGLVGLCATLLHFVVGSLLTVWWLPVDIANRVAFLIALFAAFIGHSYYTFAGHSIPVWLAFMRYMCIAVVAFLLNEQVLGFLLSLQSVPPVLALALAVSVAAMFSFFVSKIWTFRQHAGAK